MATQKPALSAGGITAVRPQPEPVVHPDGRVTFRVNAPDATAVQVVPRGDYNGMGAQPQAMTKDAEGIWTVTIGPVRPGFHYYELNVDGFRGLNPNSEVYFGWGQVCAGLDVPDPELDFYSPKDVPHGDVRLHYYKSDVTRALRRAIVYTPPGYDADRAARYPVLYLQHGAGESERGWTWQGKANFIMDNLLDAKAAVPMIVVSDNGYAPRPGTANPGRPSNEENAFEEVVLGELAPEIDRAYRTLPDRDHRAIAGLSMGAGQAMRIGLASLDTFAYIGSLSGGAGRNFDPATSFGGVLKDTSVNKRLRVFWIGCGRQDGLYQGASALHAKLTEIGVKHIWFECDGAHEWQVWRKSLREFAPLLFRV